MDGILDMLKYIKLKIFKSEDEMTNLGDHFTQNISLNLYQLNEKNGRSVHSLFHFHFSENKNGGTLHVLSKQVSSRKVNSVRATCDVHTPVFTAHEQGECIPSFKVKCVLLFRFIKFQEIGRLSVS